MQVTKTVNSHSPEPLEVLIARQLESLLLTERRLTRGYSTLSRSELTSEAGSRFSQELHLLKSRTDRLNRLMDAIAVA
jgi:hypothetical protein